MTRAAFMVALAAFLVWPALAQVETRQVDLRPKFEKGQQTRFKMEVSSTTGQPSVAGPSTRPNDPNAPRPREDRSRVELGLLLRVQSVSPDREATVDMVFESLKVTATTPDGRVEFDSTRPSTGEEDVVGMLLQGLAGSTMTLRVDRSGNVTSITGGEAFTALGQFVGGGGRAGDLFGPIFSPRKSTGLVRIGESWEVEDKIDNALLGQFRMTTRHTLRSTMGLDANLDMTGRIQPDSEAPGQSPFRLKDSSYGGRYTWDLDKGMLKQLDSTMKVRIEKSDGVTTQSETVMKVSRVR